MKKFSAILIIISLIVSAFDILDTSDISINGETPFSSTNELNQDSIDNIDVEVIPSYNILIYNLVENQTDFVPKEKTTSYLHFKNQKISDDFIQNISEPPIA